MHRQALVALLLRHRPIPEHEPVHVVPTQVAVSVEFEAFRQLVEFLFVVAEAGFANPLRRGHSLQLSVRIGEVHEDVDLLTAGRLEFRFIRRRFARLAPESQQSCVNRERLCVDRDDRFVLLGLLQAKQHLQHAAVQADLCLQQKPFVRQVQEHGVVRVERRQAFALENLRRELRRFKCSLGFFEALFGFAARLFFLTFGFRLGLFVRSVRTGFGFALELLCQVSFAPGFRFGVALSGI